MTIWAWIGALLIGSCLKQGFAVFLVVMGMFILRENMGVPLAAPSDAHAASEPNAPTQTISIVAPADGGQIATSAPDRP